MKTSGEPGPRELGERVIYALLRPAARLALAFGIPIKDLGDRLQMAYFQEARSRGLMLVDVARLLDVSPRKAALLSKQLKQNFLDVESEVALPRRVEFVLWAGPQSLARIRQVLPGTTTRAVEEALAQLVKEGRAERLEGLTPRWSVVRSEFRLVEERGWLSRLDGLDNLLGAATSTVFSRFFGDAAAKVASFARTANLRIREAELESLRKLYEEVIWPALAALDAAAKDDPAARTLEVSLLWADPAALEAAMPSPGEDDPDLSDT